MVPSCCCCNYATVDLIGMRIFNFVVLSVITTPDNVLTPHISKIHLPIVSLNVCKQGEREASPAWGWKPNSPQKALRFIKQSSLYSQWYASSECGSI